MAVSTFCTASSIQSAILLKIGFHQSYFPERFFKKLGNRCFSIVVETYWLFVFYKSMKLTDKIRDLLML